MVNGQALVYTWHEYIRKAQQNVMESGRKLYDDDIPLMSLANTNWLSIPLQLLMNVSSWKHILTIVICGHVFFSHINM